MALTYVSRRTPYDSNGRIKFDQLGHALHHCWDLPILHTNDLTQLPSVVKRALRETDGLELAKALCTELIACAEQISQRPSYPIDKIISAIEKEQLGLGRQDLAEIQRRLGIPFPRNKIDLARYYTIRLVMQGMNNQTIADFLQVDLRTVGNYVAQAKERITLILEGR